MSTDQSTLSSGANVDVSTPPPAAAPAASATPPPASTASWRDSLPDDLKSDPSLKHIADVASMAKSYVNAQKMIGADKIVVPGKNATPEQWQETFRKLGLPESPDKYDLGIPQGEKVNDAFLKGFKENALKAGVLPQQAKALFDWYQNEAKTAQKTATEQYQQNIMKQRQALKEELGPMYDKKVGFAYAAAKEFGGDEVLKHLNDVGLGDDPVVIKMLAKIGEAMGEDKVKSALGTRLGKTPDEIDSEIGRLQGSQEYLDASHPGHATAVATMQRLFNAKYVAA